MVWTNSDNVRLLTGLTVSEISDDDMNALIIAAQKEVLLQINTQVIRESVEYIDITRTNEIDGSNVTYYVKNWEGKFISDNNYDLTVDTADTVVVSVTSDGVETSIVPDSMSSSSANFLLATAVDNVDLLVSYSYSYFDPVTPDPLLKLATEYLAGAYCYMRINSSQQKQVRFGNVSITNSVGEQSAYSFLYNKYIDLIRQLNENIGSGAIWGESNVLI